MKSLEDLKKLKEKAQQEMKVRASEGTVKIVVGMGTCGIAAGARQVMAAILDELEKRNITDVIVTQTGCAGFCENEPIVDVFKDGKKVTYGKVGELQARQIVSQHIVNNQIIGELVFAQE